jgi:hypothetical protein
MMEQSRIALTARERFMLVAKDEMDKFERQEMRFRQGNRVERAKQLDLPIDADLSLRTKLDFQR